MFWMYLGIPQCESFFIWKYCKELSFQVLVLKRRSTFFDFDNLPEQGAYVPLNSEYKLFVESEYLYEFLAEVITYYSFVTIFHLAQK